MLTRTKLCALSPGQWARVRVPDYECWQKAEGYWRTKPGDEVDICVMPQVRAPVRQPDSVPLDVPGCLSQPPGSSWPNYESPRGCWISPWDFGLIDASTNSPNWDKATCDEHHARQGQVAL